MTPCAKGKSKKPGPGIPPRDLGFFGVFDTGKR